MESECNQNGIEKELACSHKKSKRKIFNSYKSLTFTLHDDR